MNSAVPTSPDGFLTHREIEAIGFASVGDNVQIDRHARFLSPHRIEIRHRVRIDAHVLISPGPEGVLIDDNVHLAVGCLLFGGGGRITVGSFSNLSSYVRCYTASDDFRGNFLFGPTVPEPYRNIQQGPIRLESCVLIGSGSLLLPGVTLHEGATCGAHSVISADVPSGAVVVGPPMRQIGQKDVVRLRELRDQYLRSLKEDSRVR